MLRTVVADPEHSVGNVPRSARGITLELNKGIRHDSIPNDERSGFVGASNGCGLAQHLKGSVDMKKCVGDKPHILGASDGGEISGRGTQSAVAMVCARL